MYILLLTIASPGTEFTIHSFFNGTFVVHASKSGNLEELWEEISKHTNIPSDSFDLYSTT